jgi:YhcN/YlaJ family sporulation lipoprotein
MVRLYLLLAASLLLLLTGCGTRENQDRTDAGSRTHDVEVRQTEPAQRETANPRETADRLASLARKVPEVKAANCVVFGNIVIVGIDVDGRLDRSRVGTIKYAVAEALRQDPQGVRAVVTADPDLAARIREISEDIRRGRPVSGFANELADIVGRLMPQMPKDTAPRKQSD